MNFAPNGLPYLTSNANAIEETEEILQVAKQELSNLKTGILSTVTMPAQLGIKKKVSKLNKNEKTFYNDNGTTLTDHSNINDNYLAVKRLCLSRRGDSSLVSKFLNL